MTRQRITETVIVRTVEIDDDDDVAYTIIEAQPTQAQLAQITRQQRGAYYFYAVVLAIFLAGALLVNSGGGK